MIARIHTTVQPVRRLIHNLLVRIGKHHPQALMYPLLVACKSQSSFRRAAAMSVVDAVRQHSATLVEQAQLVSLPLELAFERQCFSLSPDPCKAHSGLMLTSCRECCGRWWGKLSWSVCLLLKVKRERSCWLKGDVIPDLLPVRPISSLTLTGWWSVSTGQQWSRNLAGSTSSTRLLTMTHLCSQVSQELIRMAILWHEMWHEALEEASRQYFGESNVEAMLNTLMPLHEMMQANGGITLKEIAFVKVTTPPKNWVICCIPPFYR